MTDIHLYSPAALQQQSESAPFSLGYYKLQFYVDEKGLLAKQPTNTLGLFYYSPSGGTLRDEQMNIVLYSARFDKFKGYGRAE